MTDGPNETQTQPFHPEEMRALWEMNIGRKIAVKASARWTPAGIITAGLAASAVLLAVSVVIRAARRPPTY
jgi:hypothetical protein